MNTSTQLKALIRNLSRDLDINPEILHRNYMLERFLERISLSNYRDQFILKGGMLIASIVGVETRSTKDLDTTVSGISLTDADLIKVINEILSVTINDGVKMSLKKIESIRDEADYPGIRLSIESVMDRTIQTIKIDITTGDKITPGAIEYPYKLMLEDRDIKLKAYNLETILAEKIETTLSRGTANTRMRDFYDIHILKQTNQNTVNYEVLTKAFKETATYRGTYEVIAGNVKEYIKNIERSEVLFRRWEQYKSRNEYVSEISWNEVVNSLEYISSKLEME
ncbi:MAG: nucleotidyl transferase AbiEii/AbiGii toxin family protein [Gudongella sp.]|nr:nucleotidyl transferase AbiEii/AbiGii toxin family protein [Gudongella sp.]